MTRVPETPPGISRRILSEDEFALLQRAAPERDALGFCRERVQDFQQVCAKDARQAFESGEADDTLSWLQRRVAAKNVACCMRFRSEVQPDDAVLIEVTVKPDCAGVGPCNPAPEATMMQAIQADISEQLRPEY